MGLPGIGVLMVLASLCNEMSTLLCSKIEIATFDRDDRRASVLRTTKY